MKLPQHIIDAISDPEFEAKEAKRIADGYEEIRRRHREMVRTWRDARYAVEPRKAHWWSRPEWFVVDGSGWSKGPYPSEYAAENERIGMERFRHIILTHEGM